MGYKFASILFIALMFILATPVFADGNEDSNFSGGSNDSNFMVGNDRDEYGCIGSAGYSWCEEKDKCLRAWEESCESLDLNTGLWKVSESCYCSGEYVPVCGINNLTYGNSCSAKCNNVEIVYEGECKDDSSLVNSNACMCTMEYMPVCGKDGETYGNKCAAACARVEIAYVGECKEINYEVESNCICTKEYMPVCASVKDDDCICPKGAMCKCSSEEKTFSNKCMAACAGGIVISQGPCIEEDDNFNENFCGGIAAIPCKEGYTCKLDGDYPDAGGKCVYDCPQYMPPLCEEGKIIISKTNEYGCKRPVCLGVTSTSTTSVSDFYLGANWVCSNGTEFKEKSDKCMPYSYWKEKARKTCGQYSRVCDENNSFTTSATKSAITPATGNFLLDIVRTAVTNTVESQNSVRNKTTDANLNDSNFNSTTNSCKSVYVTKFEPTQACEPNCKVIIDSEGCKNISCENGETKRYCSNECKKQSINDITRLKEKCYANEGQVIVKTNAVGCTMYLCNKEIEFGEKDSNSSMSYTNTTCTRVEDLPKEKYVFCEQNGGKLLVKTNNDNCITVLECVGQKEYSSDLNTVNKEIINDSVQLLGIALKLEELKIELNKTSVKVQAISEYYKEIGDSNASIKFQNAADLLKIASNEIDAIKQMIKERADNFTETDALEVKKAVRSIKTEILNKVLMVLLD